MTALADILIDAGHSVVGMDNSITPEQAASFSSAAFRCNTPDEPQQKLQVLPWNSGLIDATRFDLCVASPAIPRSDAVPAKLLAAGVSVISLHECLAAVFADTQQICVAGTHGKSTTTAMLSWILDHNLYRPGFFVGAEQPNFGCSGRFTESRWAVIESCEFLQSFRHLQPQIVVLTGIERDHFDCFPEQQSEDAAFQQFVQQLPSNGKLVLRNDCVRSRQAAASVNAATMTFGVADAERQASGVSQKADVLATQVKTSGTTSTFRCTFAEEAATVRLNVPGRHNVQNAVAAIAAAISAGVSLRDSCFALASFSGIRRRFENRGQYNGITLIDDYAHHPTAIQETITTARQAFPGRRILVAFEPHQLIRTQSLFPQFVQSLSAADEVLLLPVFPARETATHLECCRASGRLVKALNQANAQNQGGVRAFLFANLDQIVSRVDHSGRPSDIFLTMGAGRTNIIHDQFNRRLQRNFVA